jgi:hypothetical protein
MSSSPPLGKASVERLVPKADGRVATVIRPEYRRHHPALGDTTLPMPDRCCNKVHCCPQTIGSSVERTAKLHLLWRG